MLWEIALSSVPKHIAAGRAATILGARQAAGRVDQAWRDLADKQLADLRRVGPPGQRNPQEKNTSATDQIS